MAIPMPPDGSAMHLVVAALYVGIGTALVYGIWKVDLAAPVTPDKGMVLELLFRWMIERIGRPGSALLAMCLSAVGVAFHVLRFLR